jgi:hypothetical protein
MPIKKGKSSSKKNGKKVNSKSCAISSKIAEESLKNALREFFEDPSSVIRAILKNPDKYSSIGDDITYENIDDKMLLMIFNVMGTIITDNPESVRKLFKASLQAKKHKSSSPTASASYSEVPKDLMSKRHSIAIVQKSGEYSQVPRNGGNLYDRIPFEEVHKPLDILPTNNHSGLTPLNKDGKISATKIYNLIKQICTN